jgi:hypothetical protein
MFDALKERVPLVRARVWREYLSKLYPTESAWNRVMHEDLPGMKTVQVDFVPLYRRSWLAHIPRLRILKDKAFQIARALEPRYFADITEAVHQRHVDLWIAEVQRITLPDSQMFEEVEKLSDDFHLVKAEAFLQKMKCWTPLDEEGRRT